MSDKAYNKVLEAIDKQNLPPERAEQVKAFFDSIVAKKDKPVDNFGLNIDYFKLTVCLCAAAMCVGKNPSAISFSEVRTNALGVAKILFTENGDIAPPNNGSYKK